MFWHQLHVKKDVLIYDEFNFIGDFGGYMGILLGFSILSIFDVISKWVWINMSHLWMRNLLNFASNFCLFFATFECSNLHFLMTSSAETLIF